MTHELLDMLSYKRPHNSDSELAYIDKFIAPIADHVDGAGNYFRQIGESPILWSAHTDTVHHQGGRQAVIIDQGKVKLAKPHLGTCLGADNAGGCWLLLEMIDANIPGLYVFHRDEERGGTGSQYIAKKTPSVLDGIEFAIAFDRKGYSDIITHQAYGRCASDKFASQLGKKLGTWFKPDDTGLFTDTANYTEIVAECTNVSMGYGNGHGPMEWLDYNFITRLRDRLIQTDFSDLVAHRLPEPELGYWDSIYTPTTSLVKFVKEHPDMVADFLEWNGFDVAAIEESYTR